MIGAGVGAGTTAWAGRIDEAGQERRQRSCRQAEGRVGKAVSAKLRSAGAGETWKPVQRFGAVRSDMRCLIFFAALRLRRERLSGRAFAGAEAR